MGCIVLDQLRIQHELQASLGYLHVTVPSYQATCGNHSSGKHVGTEETMDLFAIKIGLAFPSI